MSWLLLSWLLSRQVTNNHGIKYVRYWQTSNIKCTLVGNKIVDHSDVVRASPVFILDLVEDNCKMRLETFKFLDLVCLILVVWW